MPQEKERIVQYILEHIEMRDKNYIEKVVNNFEISKSSVYNYLKRLENDRIIERGNSEFRYRLVSTEYKFVYDVNPSLHEEKLFDKDFAPLLSDFDNEVKKIWRYAFCEMMNNALEHSQSDTVQLKVRINALNTQAYITDKGIGIFRNIQNYILNQKGEELTLEECASLLLAGKFTTAKQYHSGEGIFFTSHAMDRFSIFSDEVLFTRNAVGTNMINIEGLGNGTIVNMVLSNHSKKTMKSVFDMFSDVDEGFFRTQIPLIYMFPSAYPVSRSEARRLGEMISSFKEAILDFEGIDDIGQAFAHELFVLWQDKNPEIKLEVINANENTGFMIKRALRTAGK